MPDFGRRSARTASLAAMVASAAVLFCAPAFASPAAPAADGLRQCSDPIDGTTACLVWRYPTPSTAVLSATVFAADGHTLAAALVSVEACSSVCQDVVWATGENTASVTTGETGYGRGESYYRAQATWIDDTHQTHTVIAGGPTTSG